MESPVGEKKDATVKTGIDNNGVDKIQEKTNETDTVKDRSDIANLATERKEIKKEDNGPGLEKKIDSQCTDIRKDVENCNNVNNDMLTMTPDTTHLNKEKAVPASDELNPAFVHVEQNAKELIHSTL